MRNLLYTWLLFTFFLGNVHADEGMWLPLYLAKLNIEDMQEKGLSLSADQIYSVNNSSLKDAIVIFGGFCTGEVISSEGLILTNHHCGYGAIQTHSTVENDYLSDGFWAKTRDEEISNENLYVSFLIRMEDVTKRILNDVTDDMSEEERSELINAAIKKVTEEEKGESGYDVSVRSFFGGNEYYLFVYETYRDVRLVGAPPSSIGKFGGDTDNWMWPRHTGDFSLFRVYTDPNGEPAEYSPDNIPMKPRHHLPVSLGGVTEKDFAMVLGYPGSTQRYLTSYGVDMAIGETNPNRVKVRRAKLDAYDEYMKIDKNIKIKYASKHASVSNYWKYFIGQTQGLQRLSVKDKKIEIEDAFTTWVNADSERKALYGDVLETYENAYNELRKVNMPYIYHIEGIRGTEILGLAGAFTRLEGMITNDETNADALKGMAERYKDYVEDFYKDYSPKVDKDVMATIIRMYVADVPTNLQPQAVKDVAAKYKGDYKKWADKMFDKTFFSSKEGVIAFLDEPDAKKLEKDPVFQFAKAMSNYYSEQVSPIRQEAYSKMERADRLFIQALRLMYPDKKFYPDANFTMRLTYGQVLDYEPRDGVLYDYITTSDGILEKEDPTDEEFIVPEKLKQLLKERDFGRYADENGDLVTCFITNNDITGGNSGSPVINGKGELIGLAFDGNWEAMSGDIAFETELQRCISVDIRYVLFVIDKFAGAPHLIREMTIVN